MSRFAVDVGQLAELARLEAERHPARSRERRAASHLYHALTQPPAKTTTSARNAVESFGTPQAQADALALMHHLAAAAATATEGTPA